MVGRWQNASTTFIDFDATVPDDIWFRSLVEVNHSLLVTFLALDSPSPSFYAFPPLYPSAFSLSLLLSSSSLIT